VSWTSWLVWGFAATAVLTTLMAGSEGFGITRMNIPHMLGTMFTADRDRAKVYGAVFHFLNGWAFSIVYVVGFHAAHIFTWWFGALLGLLHGAFVSAVVLPVMPGVHPRMASELRGPTVARQLEPPGFLALNYGARTPISVLIAHLAFGAMLGGFYSPPGAGSRRSVSEHAASVPQPDGTQLPTAWIASPPACPRSRAANVNEYPQFSFPSLNGSAHSAAPEKEHDRASCDPISTIKLPCAPGVRLASTGATGRARKRFGGKYQL
jgi:hypothetical protein